MSDKVLSAEPAKKAVNGVSSTIKDANLSASTASKISTNLDTPITYSGDDVIVGWSDTTPDSVAASATSGGGYVKLDDSFLTGETIVTLPVSKKLYAVDDNGNLKKDDNGNAIEASWNEQSLHKLRKGFITSVSSSPLSLVYKAGSQGVGFLARTTTINLAVAAATRFSNSRQRSKYITCDATFINPNDPASMTSADGNPGRFTIKNAKLNVLEFTPQYPDLLDGDTDITTSTDMQVDDSEVYQIGYSSDDNVLGHLNIGLDFETISRTEAWDTFLNEVARTRKSANRAKLGYKRASCTNSIMKLELSIHKNGSKPSSNQAISSPTFSFFVTLLPRDNLKVEYDTSSPYVSRNYSFQIVEPRRYDIRFSYINTTTDGTPWNFTLGGQLDEQEGIEVEGIYEKSEDRRFSDAFDYSSKTGKRGGKIKNKGATTKQLDYFSNSDIRVIFTIKNVALLADGENGVEFDKMITSGNKSGHSPSVDYHGGRLTKRIKKIVSQINDGLDCANGYIRYGNKELSKFYIRSFQSGTLPILTIRKYYANNIVETGNFFDFVNRSINGKQDLIFTGIQLIENRYDVVKVRCDSLNHPYADYLDKNKVKIAVYFSLNRKEGSSIGNWQAV